MSIGAILQSIIDNGGRRFGIDRRQFSYTAHAPSRRSNLDRRESLDRRSCLDRRSVLDRRSDHKVIEIENRGNSGRRGGLERRMAFAAAMSG